MPCLRLSADNTKVWLVDLLRVARKMKCPACFGVIRSAGTVDSARPASVHIHSDVGAGVSIVHWGLRKCILSRFDPKTLEILERTDFTMRPAF